MRPLLLAFLLLLPFAALRAQNWPRDNYMFADLSVYSPADFEKVPAQDLARKKHLEFFYTDMSGDTARRLLEERLPLMKELRRVSVNHTRCDFPSLYRLLAKLPKLESLVLDDSDDGLIPELALLQQLNDFQLEFSNRTTCPAEIFTLTNLQYLHFKATKFDSIPDAIGRLQQLEGIDFSILFDRPMRYISDSIGALQQLKLCKYNYSELKEFPGCLLKMQRLERLELDNNELKTLPDAIWSLKQLRHLDLSENKLEALPCGIDQLTRLKYLDISCNRLRVLPGELLNCDSLDQLYAAYNRFSRKEATVRLLLYSTMVSGKSLHDSVLLYSPKLHFSCEGLREQKPKERRRFLQDLDTSYAASFQATPALLGNLIYIEHNEELMLDDWVPYKFRKDPVFTLAKNLDMDYELPVLPFGYRRMNHLQNAEVTSNYFWMPARRMVRGLRRSFGTLTSLVLIDSGMKKVPRCIRHCKKLEVLELRTLKIEELPAWLAKLPNLKEIVVYGDTKVPPEIERRGIKITRLDGR